MFLRHPLSLLLITVLVMLGVLRGWSTPDPAGPDAPDLEFSAARAEAILHDLIQEGVPHVAGSPANDRVRDRVVAQLEAAGFLPRIQQRFHCNPEFGSCSPVSNIIAVKPGSDGQHAVLLTAHFDSGWTGPGAADDGAGVAAILEIARMAANFPPFVNDIVFLLTDSEENGLIGADAFARYHPLFEKVRMVINLEARGVAGPSGLFETGEGNRSLIRVFSKSVERPVGNSLAYEMYKRMPNDTDYSVYRRAGVMGANFAFTRGVAVYHSAIDDMERLDRGSLQHHGDNSWGMLRELADRDLSGIVSREDAGYIDVFGSALVHYPVSITAGLDMVLGVIAMVAIFLAFRKEFRFRHIPWALLAVPFLLLAIVVGGYLLSWPLGRWPDLHPIEHPYPWVGRIALFLMLALALYVTLKLFTGRVSACAWMLIAWALVFVLGMRLTAALPSASHVALLPLGMFVLGALVDIFRRKSPAPLLVASVAGYATAAFISLYHFFMLDVVMNFDHSHVKAAVLGMLALTVMPMLLAYVKDRELTWRPALGLLALIVLASLVQQFLPGYTADRPRGMTLMYREVDGEDAGHLVLESLQRNHDKDFARRHEFKPTDLNSGRLGAVTRPAREVQALGLPAIGLVQETMRSTPVGQVREFMLDLPQPTPFLQLTLPLEAELSKVWINDTLALDTAIESRHKRSNYRIRIIHPEQGPIAVRMESAAQGSVKMAVLSWHELPSGLASPFMGSWPEDAQPAFFGPRAEIIQEYELRAALPDD